MFLAYFVRVSLSTATPTEAAILLILGLAAAFFEFKVQDEKLNSLDAKVTDYQTQVEAKLREIEAIKSQVAGIKLTSSYGIKR